MHFNEIEKLNAVAYLQAINMYGHWFAASMGNGVKEGICDAKLYAILLINSARSFGARHHVGFGFCLCASDFFFLLCLTSA